MSKRQNWTIIVLFLIMIFVPTGITMVKPDEDFSEKENRVLAQMPQVNLEDIFSGAFSKDYESYLSDQFFARNQWIAMKTAVERSIGKQESNGIYFAKDEYLIEKHSGIFKTDTAQNNLNYLSTFLKAQQEKLGTEHVKAIIAPNAVDILKEKLPPYAVSEEEGAYLEQVRDTLPEGSYVDARAVLQSHKQEDIYYRTDHHWKTLGARYVYEAWAEECGFSIVPTEEYTVSTLSTEFFGTIEAKVNCDVNGDSIEAYYPKKAIDYTLIYNHNAEEPKESLYDMSCLDGRDKYGVFFGGNQPLIEAKTQANTGRRLLIIKDSYANCFASFAMQDFDEVDLVDLRYFNESLKEFMETKDYTDILVLYNVSGFAEDTSVIRLGY